MKFKYTILYVDNVELTLQFFEKAFGLQRHFIHESGDYGELDTGATKLCFSSKRLMKELGKSPACASPDAPTFEIALETDDVAAALKRALDNGAELRQSVKLEPWGQETAYIADPNGFLIELCSPVSPK